MDLPTQFLIPLLGSGMPTPTPTPHARTADELQPLAHVCLRFVAVLPHQGRPNHLVHRSLGIEQLDLLHRGRGEGREARVGRTAGGGCLRAGPGLQRHKFPQPCPCARLQHHLVLMLLLQHLLAHAVVVLHVCRRAVGGRVVGGGGR